MTLNDKIASLKGDSVTFKGKHVLVMCGRYFYEGIVDHEDYYFVYIRGTKDDLRPRLVHDTGSLDGVHLEEWNDEVVWKHAEHLPMKVVAISRRHIESMGELSV